MIWSDSDIEGEDATEGGPIERKRNTVRLKEMGLVVDLLQFDVERCEPKRAISEYRRMGVGGGGMALESFVDKTEERQRRGLSYKRIDKP